jgi:hypothetical protein
MASASATYVVVETQAGAKPRTWLAPTREAAKAFVRKKRTERAVRTWDWLRTGGRCTHTRVDIKLNRDDPLYEATLAWLRMHVGSDAVVPKRERGGRRSHTNDALVMVVSLAIDRFLTFAASLPDHHAISVIYVYRTGCGHGFNPNRIDHARNTACVFRLAETKPEHAFETLTAEERRHVETFSTRGDNDDGEYGLYMGKAECIA